MRTIFACRDRGTLRRIARFGADRSGNIAIVWALMGLVLMLAIGAAVDVGRWLHARDQTISAVDSAVLAGGRWLQTNSGDSAGAVATAQKFYSQNVATRLPVTGDTIAFAVGDDGMSITATGTAYIQTPFLQIANIDKLPLITPSQANFSQSQLALGGPGSGSGGGSGGSNNGKSLEIALMVDVTGSMNDGSGSGSTRTTKIQDLKDAATDLINVVIWADQSKYTSKMAIVPFSEDIRLPSTALTKARGTLSQSKTVSGTTYLLSDCVVERTGSQKYTDAAPKSGQYVMGHYTVKVAGSTATKGTCTVPTSAEVVPLTSTKQTLLDKITGLTASGGTAGHLGTAWAWYMLSPNWASLWPSSTPVAYGTDSVQKIAILMTDGEYNTQYDSNGISANYGSTTSCPQAANGCSTPQARSLCTAMKAKGITVYTVGFQLGGNQTAIDTLSQCASAPTNPLDPVKFYNADDGDQLKQAFRDIALKLTSLYLSK
jgi:Flp pilus assembly protein TadG